MGDGLTMSILHKFTGLAWNIRSFIMLGITIGFVTFVAVVGLRGVGLFICTMALYLTVALYATMVIPALNNCSTPTSLCDIHMSILSAGWIGALNIIVISLLTVNSWGEVLAIMLLSLGVFSLIAYTTSLVVSADIKTIMGKFRSW